MIDTGTTRLAYDEAGAGPAVVLVHAGVADRRMWDHQFAELAKDHWVVRYDWRGYGVRPTTRVRSGTTRTCWR